jgi:hypothetical protein
MAAVSGFPREGCLPVAMHYSILVVPPTLPDRSGLQPLRADSNQHLQPCESQMPAFRFEPGQD